MDNTKVKRMPCSFSIADNEKEGEMYKHTAAKVAEFGGMTSYMKHLIKQDMNSSNDDSELENKLNEIYAILNSKKDIDNLTLLEKLNNIEYQFKMADNNPTIKLILEKIVDVQYLMKNMKVESGTAPMSQSIPAVSFDTHIFDNSFNSILDKLDELCDMIKPILHKNTNESEKKLETYIENINERLSKQEIMIENLTKLLISQPLSRSSQEVTVTNDDEMTDEDAQILAKQEEAKRKAAKKKPGLMG